MNFSPGIFQGFSCHYKKTYFPEHLQTVGSEQICTSARIITVPEIDSSVIHFLVKAILFRNNKAETEITFLVFIFLTLYPYILPQPFRWLRESCKSLRLLWKSLHSVLPTGTNQKGKILNNSLFILDFWQVIA